VADAHIETPEVAKAVEEFIASEHRDAARFDNKSVLDESGEWDLHRLAARLYEIGYRDGRFAGEEIERARRMRRRETDRG
jgi:hypothetical protein